MKHRYIIGIDPGTNTGMAVWDAQYKYFIAVRTVNIIEAMQHIRGFSTGQIKLIIEDATQVRFGTDPAKAQGAGSIKRDVSIWKEFCDYFGITYQLVRPNKKFTKLSRDKFQVITGYTGSTSSHSRDAAMLVYGM